jgi:DNA-binding protein Fis
MQLVRVAQKGMISKPLRMMAAQVIENYANENISEDLEAFGQFMYHAELLRNDHLDIYLLDLHRVDQPYRDILVEVFSQLDDMHDSDNTIDDEESDLDTPLSL